MGYFKSVVVISILITFGAYYFNDSLRNYWNSDAVKSIFSCPFASKDKTTKSDSEEKKVENSEKFEDASQKDESVICNVGDKSCERLFTPEELKKYDGSSESLGLYLSIVGHVFNVEKGAQYYRPGAGYGFFAGIDGTRAFVTGDFTENGLIDDTDGLEDDLFLGIDDWLSFYLEDYPYVGKLIGRYFDAKGEPTPTFKEFKLQIQKVRQMKDKEDELRQQFPYCNSEYKPEIGGRVWCSKLSGGIERDWAGVPRLFFVPHQKEPRCACVKNVGPPSSDLNLKDHGNRGDLDNPLVREYENCDPESISCLIPA